MRGDSIEMYLFWLVLAIIMVFGYSYFEWKIAKVVIKMVYKKEEVTLPGKRTSFIIAHFLFAFIGISALYFGLISITHAEPVPGCWLAPASIVGLLIAWGTYQRVKYLKFEDETEYINGRNE